jgi:hypothetical protein
MIHFFKVFKRSRAWVMTVCRRRAAVAYMIRINQVPDKLRNG